VVPEGPGASEAYLAGAASKDPSKTGCGICAGIGACT